MPSNYIVPQVLVFEEFDTIPAVITQPLRAHISGPHAFLLRYAQTSEKLLGALGNYDPLITTYANWPSLPVGGIVDSTYTKLFIDDARLEYFTALIGVDDVVTPVAGSANQISIANASYGFKANGVGYPRYPGLYDRDVKPGDSVLLRGIVNSVSVTLDTYVQAIIPTMTATQIQAASPEATNGTTHVASATVTDLSTTPNCNALVANLTSYDSYAAGALVDTYTVTVTGSSVGGDLRTAVLRITSASGLDDVLSIAPGEVDVFFTAGVRGLQLKFTCSGHSIASLSADDLIAGQSWRVVVNDDYVTIGAVSGGTYVGNDTTTYIATVTRGGNFADASSPPQITVTTTTGVDVAEPIAITALGKAYPVGTRGVTLTFSGTGALGLRKGDAFYIAVVGSKPGRYGILSLGHSLSPGLQAATALDLRLSVKSTIAVPQNRVGFEPLTNWDQNGTEIAINSGLIAYESSLTNAGIPRAIPVVAGDMFVEYRAWRQELVGAVGTVSDVAELATAIVGPVTPDNPLAWGVYNALNNANGTDVKFTAVANPADTNAWANVLASLVGVDDVYNLVPLTRDATVLNLFAGHCDAQSSAENGRWRGAFFSLATVDESVVVSAATTLDGTVALATLAADPSATLTAYTILTVPAANVEFITSGVKVGDRVRMLYSTSFGVETYSTYTVAEIRTENTLRLASGPANSISVASKIEIWHPRSKDEQAAAIGAAAGAYADRRIKAVWPDKIGSGGTIMEGYHLCAALAGLRSGVAPHQGLTNVALAGFDDVSRSTQYFNADQLNTMAGAGVWVVTRNNAGTIYTRHALTTDTTDLNHSAESITVNMDSIALYTQSRFAPFIGVSNVTPATVDRLYTELKSAIEYLKVAGYTPTLGAQLIDATITDFRQHATLRNRVVGYVDATLPYALDNIEIHVVA